MEIRRLPTARRDPRWRDLADQSSNLRVDGWSPRPALALTAPVIAKAALLPLEHRPWLNELDSVAPFRPEASKPRPEYPVARLDPESPRSTSLIDRQLMAQRNNL